MNNLDLAELIKFIHGLWPRATKEQIERHFFALKPWTLAEIKDKYGRIWDRQEGVTRTFPAIITVKELLKPLKGGVSGEAEEIVYFAKGYPIHWDGRRFINDVTGEEYQGFKTPAEISSIPEVQEYHARVAERKAEAKGKEVKVIQISTVGMSDTLGGAA